VHQPIQNGRTHRVVAQVFAPVLNDPVGGHHDGAAQLVAPVKVTSCRLLTKAMKQRRLARHFTALRVGEFEVATSGGIWVAIRLWLARSQFVQFQSSLHPQ
jgi:hypothetical protein